MAAQCPSAMKGGGKGGAKSYYVAADPACVFEHGFQDDDKAWLCFANWSERREPEHVYGVIDTGAINAVCGAHAFLMLDEHLKKAQLGTRQIPPPRSLGGMGGSCSVLAAAEVPVTLGAGRVGLVSTAICEGDIPFLIPLPLLSSLGAQIDTSAQQLKWPDGKVTNLHTLPSGHCGVALTTCLREFITLHGKASTCRRTAEHESVPSLLRSVLAQASASASKRSWQRRSTAASSVNHVNVMGNFQHTAQRAELADRPSSAPCDSWTSADSAAGIVHHDCGRREEELRVDVEAPDSDALLGAQGRGSESNVGTHHQLQQHTLPSDHNHNNNDERIAWCVHARDSDSHQAEGLQVRRNCE
eukprot:3587882-Amphidinium_carterae.2